MKTHSTKSPLTKAASVLFVIVFGLLPKQANCQATENTQKSVEISTANEFFDWEFSDIDTLTQDEKDYYFQQREKNLKEIEQGILTKVAYNNRMRFQKKLIVFTRNYPLVLNHGGVCTFGTLKSGGAEVLFERDEKRAMEKHGFLARNGVIEIGSKEDWDSLENTQEYANAFTALDKAEKMPKFVGGDAALQKYLKKNLKYPANETASAHVVVSFVVRNDGRIVCTEVIKSSKIESFDEEAVRVVRNMPNWVAAENNGEKVNIQMNLPIYFKK